MTLFALLFAPARPAVSIEARAAQIAAKLAAGTPIPPTGALRNTGARRTEPKRALLARLEKACSPFIPAAPVAVLGGQSADQALQAAYAAQRAARRALLGKVYK